MSGLDVLKSDRFELLYLLGQGALGTVYRAFDREKNKDVALKVLRTFTGMDIARYKQSFEAIRGIAHPNLVQLEEMLNIDGTWLFSMELVEGWDFLSYVRPSTLGFDEERLRSGLRQLALGVFALHRNGVVHRDIKPKNVLVTRAGRVVLLDLDLVTEVVVGRQVGTAGVAGTTAYMAPEQSAGSPAGAPADWYSVGVILYQALTGRLPYEGSALQVQMQKHEKAPQPPNETVLNTPSDLNDLCVNLLQYRAEDRMAGHLVLRALAVEDADVPSRISGLPGAERSTELGLYVGRQRELAFLRESLARAKQSESVSVVVSGKSGIGKTALVQEFVRRIEIDEPDALVLSGRYTLGTSVHFQAFETIVVQLSAVLWEHLDGSVNHHGADREQTSKPLLSPEDARCLVNLFPVLRQVPGIRSEATGEREIPNPLEVRGGRFEHFDTYSMSFPRDGP